MTATAPAHRDAGPTETAAARQAAKWARTLEARVLRAVVDAGDNGLTVLEALDALGMPADRRYSLAPRLSHLRKHKGLLATNGEVRDDCQVYVATPAARAVVGTDAIRTDADREAATECRCTHTRFLHVETTGKCVRRACGCTTFRAVAA